MSTIALLVSSAGQNRALCVVALSTSFGLDKTAVASSLDSGEPLQKDLFARGDPQFGERLETLLLELDALGCSWSAYEVPAGEEWSPAKTYYQITRERLRNMIATRHESLAEQQHQGWLEDEAKD